MQTPAFSTCAKQKLHVGEQRAGAQQLSDDAYEHQHSPESYTHHEPVIDGRWQRVFSGKRIGPAQNNAVGGDQRQKNAQNLVELVAIGLHQQFGGGNRRRDDHDKYRQSNGVRDHATDD